MTSRESRSLKILIALLIVLALTLAFGYQLNRPPASSAVEPVESVNAQREPVETVGAQIQLDLADSPAQFGNVGRNNLFRYREAQTAQATVPAPGEGSAEPIVAEPVPDLPDLPPPLPAIPLRYEGFARLNSADGRLTALLADEQSRFNVTEGEVLMGRFLIHRITEATVEVEDLEYDRRQTLALIEQ